MTSIKLPIITTIGTELFIVLFLLWFYTRTGTPGLLKWNPQYRAQFFEKFVFLLVPLGLFLLTPILRFILKKHPKAVTICTWLNFSFDIIICMVFVYVLISYLRPASRLPEPHGKILNSLATGEVLSVHKDSADGTILNLAFSSDPHWGAETADAGARTKILRQINSRKYDAFFILGDIGEEGDWLNVYEPACADINALCSSVPVRVVMGNHDSLVDAKYRFRKYFYGGPDKPLWNRFDGGIVHVIQLNLLWGAEDFSEAQKKWLISQLESIPQTDTVIVISHCFYYSSGFIEKSTGASWFDIPDMISKITPIFEKYNVDLVISGHNHFMNLLECNGITYAIIGAMGGSLNPDNAHVSPNQQWADIISHGWLETKISDKSILLTFFDCDGKALYSKQIFTNIKTKPVIK